MSIKHTPGPWRYQSEVSTGFGVKNVTRYEVYTASGAYGHPATCAKEGDARLITAAPELLEAARAVDAALLHLDLYSTDRAALLAADEALRLAIAKAEGK